MTRKVFILRGIPGSGKSTLAAQIPGTHLSVDTYFLDLYTGEYHFDASQLPRAHRKCLSAFNDFARKGLLDLVVDNTNTTIAEIAPYYAMAEVYGYEPTIYTVNVHPEYCQNIHGVPKDQVILMADLLTKETERFPPWWRHVSINATDRKDYFGKKIPRASGGEPTQ